MNVSLLVDTCVMIAANLSLLWVLGSGFYPAEPGAGRDLLTCGLTALASENTKCGSPWFCLLADKESQVYWVFLRVASRLVLSVQESLK